MPRRRYYYVLENGAKEPLIGYKTAKPVVFTGIYTTQPEDHGQLREAIEKLSLNDASFSYEPENSPVLGNGYRCGFLGLLHMDIVQERLEREFDLSLIVTVPGVKLIVTRTDGSQSMVVNPSDLPEPTELLKVEEPWVKISVITPSTFIGPIMELVIQSRVFINIQNISDIPIADASAEGRLNGNTAALVIPL